MGVLLVLFLAVVGVLFYDLWNSDAEERQRLEAEERRRREELDAAIFRVRQIVSEARDASLSLSSLLAQAYLDSDRAELELRERRYSPFWEAVEESTRQLYAFDQTLDRIASLKARHAEQSSPLGDLAPKFQLGIKTLPDPGPVHQRLIELYREAQTNPDFANIYELRRNTAVLIKGFTSLGQAIERLGDRVVSAVEELSRQNQTALGSIEDAVRGSASAAAEQRTALLAELERSNEMSESVRSQLREDATKRAEHERAARRMLDNIQHRRRPTIWDS